MRSDVELMLKARAGSTVAFEWLVKRHHKAVHQFFHWRLWDKELAEDFTQEVFLKLFTSLPNYEPRGPFRSYLFTIATNFLYDHFRRVKVRPNQISLSRMAGTGDDEDTSLLDRLTAVTLPPEAELERDETHARLQAAIATLPPEQYLVFVMHKLEGRKYGQIASELEIPVGTVKSRMNAAFQVLREAVHTPPADDDSADSPSRPGSARVRRGSTRRVRRTSTRRTTRRATPPGSTGADAAAG